jgi:hypothetical protein
VICLGLLVALGLAISPAAPAGAEDIRVPRTGDPAFAFTLPSGWKSEYDPKDGSVLITTERCDCAMSLSFLTLDTNTMTPEAVAVRYLRRSGANPYSKTTPQALGGIPGEAFFSTVKPKDVLLNLMLVIARIDASHYAMLMTATASTLSPSQSAILTSLVDAVRLSATHADLRFPSTGDPAYALSVPADWTPAYDARSNTLTMAGTSCNCAIVLAMYHIDTTAITTAQIAKNTLDGAGAQPSTTSGPGSISGMAGDAFLAKLARPNGVVLDIKVVLVKVDPLHYAELVIVTPPNMSPASTATLNSLLADLQIVGTPK